MRSERRPSKQDIVQAALANVPKVNIGGTWFVLVTAADLNSDQLRAYKEEGLARLPKSDLVKKIHSLYGEIDGHEYELHKLQQKLSVLLYAHGRKRPTKLERELSEVRRRVAARRAREVSDG